jgi:hypothetical protein
MMNQKMITVKVLKLMKERRATRKTLERSYRFHSCQILSCV